MAKCYKIFILLFFLPVFIFAQYDNVKFDRLESYKGLTGRIVRAIVQDDKGFMWFGTTNGLYKYDGNKFTSYFHDPNDPKSISHNWVHSICIDKEGNLWIGTYGGGLNKFDQETEIFIHYIHDKNNPNSLCDNYILQGRTIFENHLGDLWIGTQNGLSQLIRTNENSYSGKNAFINYKNDPNDPGSLSHNEVWTIYESNDHSIWIGTKDGCLNKFDRKNKKFSRLIKTDDVAKLLQLKMNNAASTIPVFIEQQPSDKQSVLTIGAEGGIYKYDYQENKLINDYNNPINRVRKKEGLSFNDYFMTQDGTFWVTSGMGGMFIKPNTNDQIYYYTMKRDDPNSLAWRAVSAIYEDRQGIIWIGMAGNVGIQKCNIRLQNFNYYRIPQDSTYNNIQSISVDLADDENTLWLGTNIHGLFRYNRQTKQIKRYKSDIKNFITTICQSPKDPNNLWIATIGQGLYQFNKNTESFTNYIYSSPLEDFINDPHDKDLYSTALIIALLFDKNGQLWLGSLRGLHKFDPENNTYISYLHDPDNPYSISSNDISALCESYTGTESVLWVGTRTSGLNKFEIDNGKFFSFKHDDDDSLSLSSNYVNSVLEDESGTLWVGTTRGLNKFNRGDKTFTRILDKEKKLNTEVLSILEDKSGNLWMNTNTGLHKFDPKTGILRTYGSDFSRWGYHQSRSGELFYVRGSRILAFYPELIKDNTHIPPVVLTDFQIFNESVKINPDGKSALQRSISLTDKITLSHEQSVFSFEFSVLDYSDPVNNKYAYKMEGVDPDWVYTDASRRFATYTQLAAGEYIFRVKGSNNDGIWNEKGTSVKIIITPPWWETNLAYSFYVILIGIIVFGVWRFQTNRLKMKQQMEMDHFEAEKLREVDKLKTRFFANISHEFRTPLTLIKGPVKQIMDGEFTGNLKQQCKMILRNSDRLLGLINQILDLSKLESGEMKLQVSETNIVKYLKGLVLSFVSLAERKKVSLKFDYRNEEILGYVDIDKLEKIITNLLSNAFKFTSEGGVVEVTVDTTAVIPAKAGISDTNGIPHQVRNDNSVKGSSEGFTQISISNTGAGIPANQIDKIFDRFYQADDNYKKDSEGSGIGLALTKELVEVCHGEISVESEKIVENETGEHPPQSPFKKGEVITAFTVILPIAKECFKEDEIVETPELDSPLSKGARGMSESTIKTTEVEGIKPKPKIEKSAPLLLIVEDNPDVTSYICSFMENDYRIITAENGKVGLKKTLDKFPDLIISDVMMPEMDGFELCKMVKTDERISHIPVILLTAKADLDSKVDGLEFGADDYVTKPFEARELKIRVKNLIEQRRKLREKFSHLIDLKPEDISASSMDEQLLQRLLAVFEDHIEEPDFTTEELAREVGLSRMHLNRKLQALINLSTHDFIRTLRLQRAAQLLSNASGTVSEIAYKVGFNNLSHFSKAFRKHYGKLPSEFSSKKN
ncbi:two-component regulator propeller domain-containing protein [Calditrichota bacterium]